MRRSTLLGETILGPAGMSAIPPTVTNAVAPKWAEASPAELLERIQAAKAILDQTEAPASVIVVGDDVPDGLDVSAGDVRFLTLSRAGLERIAAEAKASPYLVADVSGTGFPSLSGLPIVDLDKLEQSGSPRGRTLATYYRAAILGYRRGLES